MIEPRANASPDLISVLGGFFFNNPCKIGKQSWIKICNKSRTGLHYSFATTFLNIHIFKSVWDIICMHA